MAMGMRLGLLTFVVCITATSTVKAFPKFPLHSSSPKPTQPSTPSSSQAATQAANLSKPPSSFDPSTRILVIPSVEGGDSLDRYLQWGLFDSLYAAANQDLQKLGKKTGNPEVDPSNAVLARLHWMRGLACLARQDSLQARQDMRTAACMNSPMRLDSFFVPLPMIRFSDNLIRTLRAHPDENPVGCTIASMEVGGKREDRSENNSEDQGENDGEKKDASALANLTNANPLNASPSDRDAPILASKSWAYGLSAMALTALAYGVYEHDAMQKAHDAQTSAGLQGQPDVYVSKGEEVHTHFLRRNASLGVSLALGVAAGVIFYRSSHFYAQVSTHGMRVAWNF